MAKLAKFATAAGVVLVTVAALVFAAVSPASAADPIVRFYTTLYGTPNPVAAGSTITWWAQGIDSSDGTAEMSNMSWSSSICGDSNFPGIYEPGDRTPEVSCTSIAPASGTVTNTTTFHATVTATGEELDVTVNAIVNVTTDVLTPHLTVSPNPVMAGSDVTWSLSATNDGTATLADVTWSSSVCPAPPVVANLEPGGTTPVQTCQSVAPASGSAQATADFTAADANTDSPVEVHATAAVDVTDATADLGVTSDVSPKTIDVGEQSTATISLTNGGPAAASGVRVADPIGGHIAYVSSSATVGSYDPATGVWTVGQLANGARAVLTVTIRGQSAGTTQIIWTAAGDETDTENSNNSTAAVFVVNAVPLGVASLPRTGSGSGVGAAFAALFAILIGVALVIRRRSLART